METQSNNIQEKKGDAAGVDAFKLLYSMTILQVYNGDADAVSMLDELDFCFSKIFGDKKSKKEETADASDALVEILLSFASKPSQLFRRMSEQVFGAFADKISENGLDSLVSVCALFLSILMFIETNYTFSRSWKRRRVLRASKRCSNRTMKVKKTRK